MGQTVRRELQHGLQLDISVEASLSTLLIRGTIATSLNSNTGETPGVRSGPSVSLVVLFVPLLLLILKLRGVEIDGGGFIYWPDPEAPENLVCVPFKKSRLRHLVQ